MSEMAVVPSPAGGDVTTADFLARVADASLLDLRVVEISELGSGLRQVRLTGDDLTGFGHRPGQDLMVLVNTDGGRIIRRRYTIRRFDPVERLLDLHIVTDSSGPGWQWLSSLRTGDAVEAIGPRGKITLATGVEWHLFVGDEVAVPVISAMVEALPAGSRTVVVAEVTVVDDAAKIDSAVDMDWQWVLRGDRPAGDPVGLLAAATAVPLPVGVGHVYVFGEAGVVAQVGAAFEARGVERERMSTKAYWGRGRANASHGEPLRNG